MAKPLPLRQGFDYNKKAALLLQCRIYWQG